MNIEIPLPSNDTVDKIRHELACLSRARSQIISRMHYTTVEKILSNSGLPYHLVRDDRDYLGNPVRNYLYRFSSNWCSSASLYIQETLAGRQFASMRQAIDALEFVLNDHLRRVKYCR